MQGAAHTRKGFDQQMTKGKCSPAEGAISFARHVCSISKSTAADLCASSPEP